MAKRVLSGIRATGRLHLGNYLGAVKGMLELQDDPNYETLYTVVDLHATTTPYDPKTLPQKTMDVVLDYLACGIDPEKSAIYVQSDLADLIAQLMFYFSTVVTIARMQHLPTYKEKVKQYPEANTMALLNYPVLMAADILIYKADVVPVGIDQEPHLEVAREIARKMNDTFGTNFPEPTRFATKGEYVPSLTGLGKMSKSVEGSYINLTDNLATIKSKIAKVPTDSGKGEIENIQKTATYSASRRYLSENGEEAKGVDALFRMVELFQGIERRHEYDNQYIKDGVKYSTLKEELSEAIFKDLEPIQKKREELAKNEKYVRAALEKGTDEARDIAKATIKEVREKMGLLV